MRRFIVLGSAMLLALTALLPAHAHHSFPVHFVPDKLIRVSGTATGFRFRNPHALIEFTVTDGQGTETAWRAETNSPSILRRRGWSETSIKPGDAITIEGYPARDGSSYMRVASVTFTDGRELSGQRPGPEATSGED